MYLSASVNSDECCFIYVHLYPLHQIILKEISDIISHQYIFNITDLPNCSSKCMFFFSFLNIFLL